MVYFLLNYVTVVQHSLEGMLIKDSTFIKQLPSVDERQQR